MGPDNATRVNLRGAHYRATDTKDGFVIVHDLPLMATIKKGVKGAPKDIGEPELAELLVNGQRKYTEGNFCAKAFVGHNPDVDMGLGHPQFAGYILPKRIGSYRFDDNDERPTLFGDAKIPREKFQLMKEGRLPSHSPEVRWDKMRITGLAFLDTQEPHFEFATNTIGSIVEDPSVTFAVEHCTVATFMADPANTNGKDKDKENGMTKEDFAKYCNEELPKTLKKFMDDELPKRLAAMKFDSSPQKPDPTPADAKTGMGGQKTMSMDPEFAAKFAAQQNDLAELRGKMTERENKERAAAFVQDAETKLSRKVITQPLHEQIVKFAEEAVVKQDGAVWFGKFIESLMPSLRDKPPTNLAEFHAASGSGDRGAINGGPSSNRIDVSSDPELAKFVAENSDPESLEQIAKFAAQARAIKGSPKGHLFTFSTESYIREELRRWKAIRNGELQPGRPE